MSQPIKPYVLRHLPGSKWEAGTPFQRQPGVERHVEYMRKLDAQGILLAGGPFMDDSGGMAVVLVADSDEAERVAQSDPGVEGGLLKVEVRPWLVAMGKVLSLGDSSSNP